MKKCAKCNNNFEITKAEKELLKQINPVFDQKQYPLPEPELCHICRLKTQLSWRNPATIYRRTCSLCKKSIISQFSPNKPNTVYCRDCFWTDKWSALDYGREFDFNRSFSEQYKELLNKVPLLALININGQNSDYCNVIYDGKDNYYSFIALYEPEGLINTYYTMSCKYSADISICDNVAWSYKLVDCQNCHECFYSRRLNNCRNCYFCEDLIGCNNCFGCKNLINASFCIYNKKYSEDEYNKFIKDTKLDLYSSIEKYKSETAKFFLTLPNRNTIAVNCENSSGTYLNNDQNCYQGYALYDCKDFYYGHESEKSENCYSCTGAGASQFCTNCSGFQSSTNCHFCINVTDCNNLWYSYGCYSNSCYSFGCIGLKNNIRCILNKEYPPEEYEKQVTKIVDHMKKTGEWGQLMKPDTSPFGYNESVASYYFPLSKTEIAQQGFNYCSYQSPVPNVEKIITAKQLPEDTDSVTDKILNWAIKCEDSGRLFKLTANELGFYQKYKVPIPRKHPDVRHLNRISRRLPVELWTRKCAGCKKEMLASYPPDFPGAILCQECYNKKI